MKRGLCVVPAGILVLMLPDLAVACPKGSQLTVRPGESIQAAVDAASPGDTIKVRPGVYHESVVISTECLTLKGGYGGGGGWAVLDGTGAGVNGFTVAADHTTIEGFEIRNYTLGGVWEGSGIQAACPGSDYDCGIRPSFGTVRSNLIHDNYYAGVNVGVYGPPTVTGWRIQGNDVSATAGEWAAIALISCSDCKVADNVVTTSADAAAGINVAAENHLAGELVVSGVRVEGNEVTGPSELGILVDSIRADFLGNAARTTDVQVEGNTVQGAAFSNIFARGRLANDPLGPTETDQVKFEGNVSVGAGAYGIDFQHVNDSVMEGNTSSNSLANFVFITGSHGNRMEGNLSLSSLRRGLVVAGGSYDNVLEGNIVRDSGWDGIFLPGVSGNRVEGNLVEDSGLSSAVNGHGIRVQGGTGNEISENDVSDSSSSCDLWWNGSGANCWEDNIGSECPDPLPVCD